MRIVTIIGNRPQFVKAAAVSDRLRAEAHEVLVHTGQHYDDEMSRIFFEELGIPAPDVELGIGSGTNTEQTARMLAALEPVIGSTIEPNSMAAEARRRVHEAGLEWGGGVYISGLAGGVYYANPQGVVSRYGEGVRGNVRRSGLRMEPSWTEPRPSHGCSLVHESVRCAGGSAA